MMFLGTWRKKKEKFGGGGRYKERERDIIDDNLSSFP